MEVLSLILGFMIGGFIGAVLTAIVVGGNRDE